MVFGTWVVEKDEGKKNGGLFPLAAFVQPFAGAAGGEVKKKIFDGRRRRKRVKYV